MITIDGKNYNAEWVANSLVQTADILNGDNTGRLQSSKSMYLDYVGTFFNHKGQIRRTAACTDSEWDSLYLALANPVNSHTVSLPFGQGTLTTEIYISQIARTLVRITAGGVKVWGRVYDVSFVSVDSQWLAGGGLTNYTEG